MLKALVNEARLRLNITTTGPLLVKTGYATVIGADMAPVETYRHGHKEVFLPGSSLKGVFRSHIEKIINSIQAQVACNPFEKTDDNLYRAFCGSQPGISAQTPGPDVYRNSCPTCRLFGSTHFAGRLAIEDAYLVDDGKTLRRIEHRDHVGIDRLTGGAKPGAKFDLEAVTAETTFSTMIHLRNFEIWQLGILFVIIKDLEDELIYLGSGRSRGLGKITAQISEQAERAHQGGVVLSTIRTSQAEPEAVQEIWGLGRWLPAKERELYGTKRNDTVRLPSSQPYSQDGIRNLLALKGEMLQTLRKDCIDHFITSMREWQTTTSESSHAAGKATL